MDRVTSSIDNAWTVCGESALSRMTAGGALAAGASFILFRSPARGARSLLTGFGLGAGAGSAYELCNARFMALQAAAAKYPATELPVHTHA